MPFSSYLIVMIGGALGTLARYGISVAALPISHRFPWSTLVINVAGSFAIGFFGALTLAHGRYPAPENLRLFVMVGLCGGFTTFSSFSLQTLELLQGGAFSRAALNVVASVMLCLLAVALGHYAAAKLNGDAKRIAQILIEEEA